MNADDIVFNVGDEFTKALGGSQALPPGSLTLIGHPRGWNAKPLVYELVKRGLNNAPLQPRDLKVLQFSAGDVNFIEDKILPSLLEGKSLEPGHLLGFTLDCSSTLRPFGGQTINKTMGKVRQVAQTLQIPAIVTMSFKDFLVANSEHAIARYDTGMDAANQADLELYMLGKSHIDNQTSWALKVGKCRHILTERDRRIGVIQKYPT